MLRKNDSAIQKETHGKTTASNAFVDGNRVHQPFGRN